MMQGMTVKNMSFKVGQTLTLVGTAKPDASNFAVNIGPDEKDITMHMNPRFEAHGDQNTLVCNSYQDGTWCEEQRVTSFPFQLGGEFKYGIKIIFFHGDKLATTLSQVACQIYGEASPLTISITFNPAEFLVVLTDGSSFTFPNRMGREKYSVMNVDGDARITSIEIK